MISFRKTLDEYGFLNTVSPYGFELDGCYWPTVEHYVQAQKFAPESVVTYQSGRKIPVQYHIRCQPTAKMAVKEGHRDDLFQREDWEKVKEEVMRKALLAKFKQNPQLAEKLLATGQEELVYSAPDDYYWGAGQDGSGENRLGALLMEIRESLRQ